MDHDFGDSTTDKRFSSKGEACTGIGGYMDYVPSPNKWSPCSVEDFTAYYNAVDSWCLAECKVLYVLYPKDYHHIINITVVKKPSK